ncbi:ROK family [Seminavis robusta]|uniref:fructokinase n=1 Tax=Seminavis robusta TaxID=568900 RepID=A0A9N8HDT8_9STRA|nr:ROK family [Seminavis robusta]|eukprot:Sro376_g129710.1 ROK family (400) ;mRNA; f:30684-31883
MSSSNNNTVFTKESPAVIAAVEAGGTSFVVAICHHVSSNTNATDNNNNNLPTIIARHQVDSSHDNPAQTLDECCAFLKQHKPPNGYHALGIASFGPLGVHVDRPDTYGKILASTPKAHWRHVDLLTPLRAACQGTLPLKIKVDTDVNAPAMAEHLLLSSTSSSTSTSSSLAYITVGTGIGVGLVVNHKPVHGRMHPEGGHVPVQPLPGDTFEGYSWGAKCPFHGKNTVEGLASSVALTERYLSNNNNNNDRSILATLSDDDELWDHAANALANLCTTLLLTLSMETIVLGGGLMQRKGLLENIQQRTLQLINGYLVLPDITTVIVTSRFGNDAGLMGTIVLAQMALTDSNNNNKKDDKATEKTMKQTAFQAGLWHGTLVGIVGTALVCKYWFLDGNKRK